MIKVVDSKNYGKMNTLFKKKTQQHIYYIRLINFNWVNTWNRTFFLHLVHHLLLRSINILPFAVNNIYLGEISKGLYKPVQTHSITIAFTSHTQKFVVYVNTQAVIYVSELHTSFMHVK